MGNHPSRSDDPFDDFTEKKLEALWKRSRYHVHERYWWLPASISDGVDLDDLAAQAICDVLSGIRRWPPGLHPMALLKNVVKSRVTHLLEREARLKARGDLSTYLTPEGSARGYDEPADSTPSGNAHLKVEQREFWRKVHELIGDDGFLIAVIERLMQGMKPREIAATLGTTVNEVRNAQKRLRRRLEELR